MPMHYSDPSRAELATALPDVETFEAPIVIVRSDHGEWEVPGGDIADDAHRGFCPDCGRAQCVWPIEEGGIEYTDRSGWYYWHCFPGCLPDSDPIGPFDSEAEALADAREGVE